MAIYLGNTILTGSGGSGGGSIPVNSYAVFYGETSEMIETNEGSIWLRTGSILTPDGSGTATDAATYTDASSSFGTTGTTFTTQTNWFGGGQGIGIVSDFENNRFYCHADNNATTIRWVDVDSNGTPQNARGSSNPAQFENQNTTNSNANRSLSFSLGSNTLTYNQRHTERGRGSTSRGYALATGDYPAHVAGANQYTPDSSNVRYFSASSMGLYSNGTNRIVHSFINEIVDFASQYATGTANQRECWTVHWNVDGVTAGTSGNLGDSQRVGLYPGYALRISNTQFVTITGPDQAGASLTTTPTVNFRNFSDGQITRTSELSDFNTTISYQRNITNNPTIGTLDGGVFYNLAATGTTNGVPQGVATQMQTYNQAAETVGDSVAKFNYIDTNNTSTGTLGFSTGRNGGAISSQSGSALRNYEAIHLYVKIGNA